MHAFDPNDYRKRVLAAVERRGGLEQSDAFELYDIPLDAAERLTDAEVSERIDAVWAFWQKQRDHPKYRVLVGLLVDAHRDLSAPLRGAAARSVEADRVRRLRARRDAERYEMLDTAIERLVQRHGGIPAAKLPGLEDIGKLGGLTPAEVHARLNRHPRLDDAPPAPAVSDQRRHQIRTLLAEYERLHAGEPYPTLLSLLGLDYAKAHRTPEIRLRANALRARARELPPGRIRVVLDELLIHISDLLEPGPPTVDAYLRAVTEDVTTLLRPQVRAAVLVEDRLVAPDFDYLLRLAITAGLDRPTAEQVLHTLTDELGTTIEGRENHPTPTHRAPGRPPISPPPRRASVPPTTPATHTSADGDGRDPQRGAMPRPTDAQSMDAEPAVGRTATPGDGTTGPLQGAGRTGPLQGAGRTGSSGALDPSDSAARRDDSPTEAGPATGDSPPLPPMGATTPTDAVGSGAADSKNRDIRPESAQAADAWSMDTGAVLPGSESGSGAAASGVPERDSTRRRRPSQPPPGLPVPPASDVPPSAGTPQEFGVPPGGEAASRAGGPQGFAVPPKGSSGTGVPQGFSVPPEGSSGTGVPQGFAVPSGAAVPQGFVVPPGFVGGGGSAPARSWEAPLRAARAALRGGHPREAAQRVAEARRRLGEDGAGAAAVRSVGDEVDRVLAEAGARWRAVHAAFVGKRFVEGLEHLDHLRQHASDVPDPDGSGWGLEQLAGQGRAAVHAADREFGAVPAGPPAVRTRALRAVLEVCADHPAAVAALEGMRVEAPAQVTAARKPDGTVVITWSPSAVDEVEYRVTRLQPDGSWRVVGRTRGTALEDGGAGGGPTPVYGVVASLSGLASEMRRSDGEMRREVAVAPDAALRGLPTVRGLAVRSGLLIFQWPTGITEVMVVARVDAPPTDPDDPRARRWKITNTRYQIDGGVRIPAEIPRPCHLAIASCRRDPTGILIVAAGFAPDARIRWIG
ncbi:hypothetical protein [Nocardia sp. NPDC020380]|uniref:hypothetical protein n=1 Tax=Nocardia sp. NPDC020380 TaxID=3364309 RepID=UPI00378B7FEF